jgi:hypothetical protein
MRLIDFEERARKLVSLLLQRGYVRSELAKQFVKVFSDIKLKLGNIQGV